ncbi:MAG: type II toxin-antitoxin system RelE/ParE family toxin [Ureaplasma sp.]|nr:type II toxin-antitoxin system RelE/ParE family toxin [Ureaplasma sp.]
MSHQNFKTVFFCKSNQDKVLVYDYLINEVPKYTANRIVSQMILLEKSDVIKPGLLKVAKFQNGMLKIKIKDGNNNCRIYFIIIDNVIYYLYAYNKKTQKTHENIKVKINNLKFELECQIKEKFKYLNDYLDLNKLIDDKFK